MAHVLGFALGTLSPPLRQTLNTIAAFRMPTTYDTLTALLVGDDKVFVHEDGLDSALSELEERGLLGWDKQTNRYDLHPIIRGITWNGLDHTTKQNIYSQLQAHFESWPTVDWDDISHFDDLFPTIELYHTLIGLERYEDAYFVFHDHLHDLMYWRLSATRQHIELLKMLFPNGIEDFPSSQNPRHQAFVLDVLAQAYRASGQPAQAVLLHHSSKNLSQQLGRMRGVSISLCNLAFALSLSGRLYQAEMAARQGFIISNQQNDRFWQAVSLAYIGLLLATRGMVSNSETIIQKAIQIDKAEANIREVGINRTFLAQNFLWLGHFSTACSLADEAWKLVYESNYERDLARVARLQGAAALGLGDQLTADERLHHALKRARTVNFVEEELQALIALAELRRRQNNLAAARDLLDDVWEPAERGPYPLFHADALNVLAQIERDAGNMGAAIRAATQAYRLAWCDGPPFAYHWGLQKAKAHLVALDAPFPDLPPFDPSKYEPMPEVEINPLDEFHVPE